MIEGSECKPVFFYRYRPSFYRHTSPQNVGFSVHLYENGVLVFSLYDENNNYLGERCFMLGRQVLRYYFHLMAQAKEWLKYAPHELRGQADENGGSQFAFDSFAPFTVYGMNSLFALDCLVLEGYYARRIYVLFEDVANLFRPYSIRLTLRSFDWDSHKLNSFQRDFNSTVGYLQA